ncbi:hypothetical protein JB92DRAFT_3100091 [Gautieria morchelliformis]|nr:hypothetical protein JB92DRAFT_3100091 [Gautieria morchelliformis]
MAGALADLGVAASVIAVVQITKDVITKCSAYGAAYKNASEDMSRLSDQVSGVRGVPLDLNVLIMAEEARTFSRLPTLITALGISHDDQTLDEPSEVTKSEDNARGGYVLSGSMPSERAVKCIKRKGGKNMIDIQCEHTHDELQSLSKRLETKNVRASRSRKEALVYAFKQGEVNKTLDRLQLFQQIVVALSIAQARLALEAQRRQDIYTWLAAPDYESKHWNAAGERVENTGSWFLRGESFLEWKSKPKSFLWLHGKAGAGKTTLCSTIIREIFDHSKSDPSVAVAFFYFDFRSKDIETPSILRALIKQLHLQSARAPAKTSDYLMKLFSDKENGQGSLSPEELKSTLKSMISTFENVYIILDALDECPDRHRFLGLIKEIHGWNFDTLHLLATSRDEKDIEKTLRDDIRVYVSRKLKDDDKLGKYSGEKKETIKSTLIEGAHGIWMPYESADHPTSSRWHSNLPKTLYETYDRILLGNDESNRDYALKLLQWLAFSVDPVSLGLAVAVLATDPDAETGPLFDPERRFDDPWDILTMCSSLVSVTTFPVSTLWIPRKGDISQASSFLRPRIFVVAHNMCIGVYAYEVTRSHLQLVPIPKAALPDLQMRPWSLRSIFPPNFLRPFNALRPVSPVLPQRTATVQSSRTTSPNLVKPSSNAIHFLIVQYQTARRWFTLRPPPTCPSMTPRAAVFTGVSRTKSGHFQAPNLRTTTTTPPGSSPTKHSPS